MRYLIDTNVLLRWSLADDPHFSECTGAVDTRAAHGAEVCICAQVIIEYWAASTRPLEVNGFGLAPADVEGLLHEVDAIFTLLAEPPDIAIRWRALASAYSVEGKQAHDARLVALMLAHGITHLLTLNPSDFARYSEITAVTPQEII